MINVICEPVDTQGNENTNVKTAANVIYDGNVIPVTLYPVEYP